MSSPNLAAVYGLAVLVPLAFALETHAVQGRGGRAGQARDNAPQVAAGTGAIAGRVTAADTGRPIKRARVIVSGAGRPFSATTDEQGRFRVEALPAGSFTITASKTGFVDAVYGQRRPMTAGTPLLLEDAQHVTNVDLTLSRGGVITGRVLDEDGEPLALAIVTVHRQRYVRGEKQLSAAGVDQSDDRGQFRIFGLPPGDYFVSAEAGGLERLARQLLSRASQQPATSESTGYAATYYPGVIAPSEATPLRLGPAQVMTAIDFPIQLVALATVRGAVAGGAATVMLLPEGSAAGRRGGRGGRGGGAGAAITAAIEGFRGGGLRAATRADGSFLIPNVTPGRYTVVARGGSGPDGGTTAVQPITVVGPETSVALSLAPGATVSGTVTLEAASMAVPRGFSGFRVSLTPLGAAAAVPRAARPAQANERGEFSTVNVIPGQYAMTANSPRGWTLKAVYLNGQDVTDYAVEIKSSDVSGLNVIFTDRLTGLNGVVRDAGGNAAPALTVVAFAADPARWHAHSRYIHTARTDQNGAYRLDALPPGDYLVVAVDDVDQGEWFDPAFLEEVQSRAVRVRLDEGDQRTEDLKGSAP